MKIYENIKKEQINTELINVSKQVLLKSHKAFIAIFLSYGNKSGIEDIERNTISIESIVERFSNENCSYLIGKPKIFIICSCRGGIYHVNKFCVFLIRIYIFFNLNTKHKKYSNFI